MGKKNKKTKGKEQPPKTAKEVKTFMMGWIKQMQKDLIKKQ